MREITERYIVSGDTPEDDLTMFSYQDALDWIKAEGDTWTEYRIDKVYVVTERKP